jgi:hypothetical protein
VTPAQKAQELNRQNQLVAAVQACTFPVLARSSAMALPIDFIFSSAPLVRMISNAKNTQSKPDPLS